MLSRRSLFKLIGIAPAALALAETAPAAVLPAPAPCTVSLLCQLPGYGPITALVVLRDCLFAAQGDRIYQIYSNGSYDELAAPPQLSVESIDSYRQANFAMTLLGQIAPGERITERDYAFIRNFAEKGMSPEDLARRIEPYFTCQRYGPRYGLR